MVTEELLQILRCPRTGQKLRLVNGVASDKITGLTGVETVLVTEDGKLGYRVENNVPVLLNEMAIELPERER